MSQPEIVSPGTRHKVLQAVEDLGYTPNSAARHLRTLRSGKLLVTVPDISNPFFALILQGIEDAAHRDGYAVLLGDTQHDETREERYALMLRRKEADGLIFLGHRLPEAAQAFIRSIAPRCAPVVNSCEFSPRLGVPGVHIDNAKAASDAIDHLYRLGHQRIGIVTGPLVSPLSRDRLRGVKTRAKLGGAEPGLEIVTGNFSIESGAEAADRLLSQPSPPTAIFCFNDEMAIGVLDIARQRGVRVPRDLSVVGFDDIRFARLRRSAAHDHRAADAGDRRGVSAAAPRHPPGQDHDAPVDYVAPHADHPLDDGAAWRRGGSKRLRAFSSQLSASSFQPKRKADAA